MDGTFYSGDDGRGLIPMSGTVTECNGGLIKIITDDGECVALHQLMLSLISRKQPVNVGDRVHFWARKRVKVTYELEELGEVVPTAPDAAEIRRLRDLNIALERRRHGDDDRELPIEDGHGIIESYDAGEGEGVIRRDDGVSIRLHRTCLRGCGYLSAEPGSRVHFEAIARSKGWLATRILALDPPFPYRH